MTTKVEVIRDLWHDARQQCIEDPFFLGQHVMGFDYRNPAKFHRKAVEAMKADKNYLLLAPRGHGKTWLCDQVGVVWEILRDPDIRILLCHGVLDRAQKILKAACDQFRGNTTLHELFPEHKPDGRGEDPTITKFTTPARRKIAMEPTIMAAAPGSTVTALHFDLIKATDLVNEQNVPAPIGQGTIESMDKVTEFVKTFVPLLDATNPKARRQFDGTRWHDSDAWGFVIDEYTNFEIITEGISLDEEGRPIPIWDLVGVDWLEAARQEAGSWLWAANYCQDPLPSETAMFFRENFIQYRDDPGPMDIAITVDLAWSQKKEADRTAIVVAGVTPEGAFHVLHAAAGHWRAEEVIERLYTLDLQFSPRWIGIESVSFQQWLCDMLYAHASREGRVLPIRELRPDGNKMRRAFGLSWYAQRYGIHVKYPEHEELVSELTRFPAARHDDYVDAIAYRMQDLRMPHVRRVKAPARRVIDTSAWHTKGEDVIKRLHSQSSAGSRFRIA